MSSKDWATAYMGIPQLDQLTHDLRAAELFREAPRLSVPEDEFEGMNGVSLGANGRHYRFGDDRESHSPKLGVATQFGDCLGTFKLETGKLAHFMLLSSPAQLPFGSKIRPMIVASPRILQYF